MKPQAGNAGYFERGVEFTLAVCRLMKIELIQSVIHDSNSHVIETHE